MAAAIPQHRAGESGSVAESTSLVGRSAELALARRLLGGRGGAALLYVGGPGTGKTALLDEVARQAADSDALVLRADGAEAESRLPYAALSQLLRPALADLGELAEEHQRALDRVLRIGGPAEHSDPVVALAVLSLLELLAEHQPTVLVFDDLQWIDRESAEVLYFVRRRIGWLPVVLVASADEPLLGQDDSTERRTLEPLTPVDARALLDRRAPGLEPHLREALLREAAGNPLALVELPASAGSADLSGLLTGAVAVNRHIERAFARRFGELDSDAKRLLLLLACLDSNELAELAAAAEQEHLELAFLQQAEEAGLVDARDSHLSFSHPLVRSVVRQAAPATARRTAHQTLAVVLAGQPQRAVWHRAAAATGVDESLAAELESLSEGPQRRDGASALAAALERAADLSTDPVARARRFALAADAARAAGRYAAAETLLNRVELADADQATRVSVASQRGWQLFDTGNVDEAVQVLLSAARDALQLGTDAAIRPAAVASLARWLSGTRRSDADLADVVRRVADAPVAPSTSGAPSAPLALMALAASDAAADPVVVLAAIRAARAADMDPWEAARLGDAALIIEDLDSARSLLQSADRKLRSVGSFGALATVLTSNARAELAAGNWPDASRMAAEALEIAEVTGQQRQAAFCRCTVAQLAAARGDAGTTELLTTEVLTWARPRHQRLILAVACWARMLLALGDGDYQAAAAQVTALHAVDSPVAGELLVAAACADAVEALCRADAREDAEQILRWATGRGKRWQSPLLDALTARSRAVLTEYAGVDEGSDEGDYGGRDQGDGNSNEDATARAYATAVQASLAVSDWEQARVRLLFGIWLRRRRRIAEARGELRAAESLFESYAATPWVQRCRAELRAAGAVGPAATGAAEPVADASIPTDQLTAQEQVIVELAAEGLSNRAIGEKLFLSPRTVGSHLYRAFPKLGVSNRAQLRDALQRRGSH